MRPVLDLGIVKKVELLYRQFKILVSLPRIRLPRNGVLCFTKDLKSYASEVDVVKIRSRCGKCCAPSI